MSIVLIIAATTAAATIAAAQKKAKEKENMPTYGKNDLDGWEFKIVRSNL